MKDELTCDVVEDRGFIERYFGGRLSEGETEALESHYLTCPRCQDELRLGMGIRYALLEDEPVSRAPLPGDPFRKRGWFAKRARIGGLVAAVAAILAGILLVQPSVREPQSHREDVPETAGVPWVAGPAGEVRAVEEFRWESVAGADLYRLILFNTTGEVIGQVDTRDTHIPIEDLVELEPGLLYLWQVDARVGWDRWVSSELVRFTISER